MPVLELSIKRKAWDEDNKMVLFSECRGFPARFPWTILCFSARVSLMFLPSDVTAAYVKLDLVAAAVLPSETASLV